MKTMVQKWGHSLALRIPKAMAEHMKVREGAPVELVEQGGSLMVKPLKAKPSLKKMLSQVTPDNLHGETGTGKPAGKEIW